MFYFSYFLLKISLKFNCKDSDNYVWMDDKMNIITNIVKQIEKYDLPSDEIFSFDSSFLLFNVKYNTMDTKAINKIIAISIYVQWLYDKLIFK